MAETSRPWDGTTVGDAVDAPYDAAVEWVIYQSALIALETHDNNGGVVLRDRNHLRATLAAAISPVAINTGAAIVDGAYYSNSASLNVTIPTPIGATRYDRIVLRKDYSAQTIRIFRLAGVEGGGIPALVQLVGITWDIPLATVTITIAGVLSIYSDDRQFINFTIAPYRVSVTRLASADTIVGVGALILTWDYELSNPDTMWAVGNPTRITIPVPGRYEFIYSGGIRFTGALANADYIFQYRINGSYASPVPLAANALPATVAGIQVPIFYRAEITLAQGDYVELEFYNQGYAGTCELRYPNNAWAGWSPNELTVRLIEWIL